MMSPVMEMSLSKSENYLDITNNSNKYNIDCLTNDILVRLPPYAIFAELNDMKAQSLLADMYFF